MKGHYLHYYSPDPSLLQKRIYTPLLVTHKEYISKQGSFIPPHFGWHAVQHSSTWPQRCITDTVFHSWTHSVSPEESLKEHKFQHVLYASLLHHRHQRVKNMYQLSKEPFILVFSELPQQPAPRRGSDTCNSPLPCAGKHSLGRFPVIKLLWEASDSDAGLGNYLTRWSDSNKWTSCLNAAVLPSHMTVWKFCCPKSVVSSLCNVMHQCCSWGAFHSKAQYSVLSSTYALNAQVSQKFVSKLERLLITILI